MKKKYERTYTLSTLPLLRIRDVHSMCMCGTKCGRYVCAIVVACDGYMPHEMWQDARR